MYSRFFVFAAQIANLCYDGMMEWWNDGVVE